MSKHEWDALTTAEEAFMVSSYEIDILAGVWGDLDEADQSRPVGELAGILLALIDRGWIEVRRLAPWTSPSGANGFQSGPAVVEGRLVTGLPHQDRLRIHPIMLRQQVHGDHARIGVTVPVTDLLERPWPPSRTRQQGLLLGVALTPPPKPVACQSVGIVAVECGHVVHPFPGPDAGTSPQDGKSGTLSSTTWREG
ncbi:hypothetical protein [Streptomyces sp. CB02460]|uniref:hypothetical protein n=1 Tax=Streptomyces sp. CB02460 TaxID=1703941 RepID=UPI0018FECC25|nr:hypothetical protein [Streptomyces sp. CB02460]